MSTTVWLRCNFLNLSDEQRNNVTFWRYNNRFNKQSIIEVTNVCFTVYVIVAFIYFLFWPHKCELLTPYHYRYQITTGNQTICVPANLKSRNVFVLQNLVPENPDLSKRTYGQKVSTIRLQVCYHICSWKCNSYTYRQTNILLEFSVY